VDSGAARVVAVAVAVAAALVPAAAAPAAAGPSATAPPTVSGTLQQGKKLTALTGTWLGAGTITYVFQWYRCDANGAHCSSIHGSTRSTYTEVARDAGKTLGLTVRATDSTGTTAAYAAIAGLVAPAASTLAATAQPVLAGDPIVGTAITVQNPGWSAVPATTTYAWLRCNANGRACAAIAGQTGASYTLAAADVGHTVVAAATASVGGTVKQTVLTIRSAVVRTAPGPLATAAPSVSGSLQQGMKLTASPGTWSAGGALTYAFQWYRCDANGAHCSSIHGATKSTYTQVVADVGHTLGLTVRTTDSTGTTPAYAAVAGIVAAAGAPLVASAQPKLHGTAAAGATLTVEPVTWAGTPSSTTYAWLRCNANGRICTAIAGQTTGSYVLTSADAGHTIVTAVTGASGTTRQTVLSVGVAVPA
jgi:hypothetical protein